MTKIPSKISSGWGWTVGSAVNIFLTSLLLLFPIAQAQQPQTAANVGNGDNITICHATASASNPFVVITVDHNSIIGDSGHGNSGINAGDIIPPFDYGTDNSQHFAGQNWDSSGQSFWNNNCAQASPNNDTGTLMVQKIISGGEAASSDFSLHVMSNNTEVSGSPQAGSSSGTSYTLAPGSYTVSESGGPSNYTASFNSGCSNGNITVVANQTATCTVTNTFNAPGSSNSDLAVTKAVNNQSPFVGNSINYTVTVTNNGPHDASGVTLSDTLPSGLTFVSASSTTGSFNSSNGTWTVGNLANGLSATLNLTATVNTGTGGDTITNTATVSGAETDTNTANNSATASLTVQTNPPDVNSIDLAVNKTVNDNSPGTGDTVTYTIMVTNNGPHSASNVILNDLLPTGLTFASSVVGQGSFDNNTGVWTIGSLNNGASVTMTLAATVNNNTGGNTITNTATVTGTETDNNPANNSASVNLTVGSVLGEATTDLSIDKTVNTTSPQRNSNVTYTLTVTNHGPGNATGVTLTDLLPTGTTFVSSTTANGSFSSSTGQWIIGSLADGQSVTLSLVAQATAARGAQVTNTATVSGNEQDIDLTNNADSAQFRVRRSSGGGGGSSSNNQGQVLGENTNVPSIQMPAVLGETANPDEAPAVLGETADLPRTGTPTMTWLLLFLLLSIPFALQRQING